MRSITTGSCISSVVLAQLALVLSIFALNLASSEESLSSTKAALQNSRQKRSGLTDGLLEDRLRDRDLVAALKRAPGWGKRFSEMIPDDSVMEEKRAPGWGKRSFLEGKRGWGKRAPGWGKRAPGWGKRAPGWGKRAPGWGKRAPGWGKRSDDLDICSSLEKRLIELNAEAEAVETQRRMADCGGDADANELQRK